MKKFDFNQWLDAMQLKEYKRVAQQQEDARTIYREYVNKQLRDLLSDALNMLPTHLQVSAKHLNANALVNNIMPNYCELTLAVASEFTHVQCDYLSTQLQNVLDNVFAEARTEFYQRIISDHSKFILHSDDLCRNDILYSAYSEFYNANSYRLLHVSIDTIDYTEGFLHIYYIFDDKEYWSFRNYWGLINQ